MLPVEMFPWWIAIVLSCSEMCPLIRTTDFGISFRKKKTNNAPSHMSRDMTKLTKWLCAKRRLRSAWASAQSDQSLRCPHEGSYPLSASEDSDQTGRMSRQIWVFAGHTVTLLVLSCRGSYPLYPPLYHKCPLVHCVFLSFSYVGLFNYWRNRLLRRTVFNMYIRWLISIFRKFNYSELIISSIFLIITELYFKGKVVTPIKFSK